MIFDCFSSAAACRSFGLGVATGLVLASAGFALHGSSSTWDAAAAPQPVTSDAGVAAWHRSAAGGDLASAVRISLGLVGAPAVTAASVPGRPVPADGGSLLARAEEHRRRREFREACELYAKAAGQGELTADAWADYADAQASLAGRLSGPPEQAIETALRLAPDHPKALWLKASAAHEQHRYSDALSTWRRLLTVMPEGSTDARIVEANIAEATRLAST